MLAESLAVVATPLGEALKFIGKLTYLMVFAASVVISPPGYTAHPMAMYLNDVFSVTYDTAPVVATLNILVIIPELLLKSVSAS